MAAKPTLLVPLRIDGLYVESDGLQFGPTMADFSALPYYLASSPTPQNSKTPNLAESIVNQTNSLAFPKGLHLHWALPDALTTGYHRGDDTVFPAVPNRWLVRRLDHTGKLERSMIVESDFLHPLDNTGKPTFQPTEGSAAWAPITFPTKPQQVSDNKQGAAFRYMGRTQSVENWLQPSPGSEFLNQRDNSSKYKFSDYPLTAVGYGEPSFAAYYPNCYSVFGFCDIDAALQPASSYEYQVIGWFNETDLDPLQSSDFAKFDNDADRYNALQSEYKWIVDEAGRKNPFPSLTVLYGSLTLTPNQVQQWHEPNNSNLLIAVGNTGGEALAALLADQLAPSQKELIEDQLEAINAAPALQGVEIDYKAHFAQTRHQRGFRGLSGGSRWAVVPASPKLQPITAAEVSKDAGTQTPLPDAVAHALDALNSAQEDYDKAQQEIAELRYQTFCDWHKFMIAAYINPPSDPFKAQITNLAQFISDQTLTLLNNKIIAAGKLTLEKDFVAATGKVPYTLTLATNAITPAGVTNENLAVQVILRLQALINTLKTANITDKFEIRNQPADNFWRPREPVVLLSGLVAVSTQRHGEDGNLPCNVLDLPDAPGTKAFLDTVDKLKPNTPNNPFVQTQSGSPWHPIILDWSVAVTPVGTGRKANDKMNGAYDYEPSFLSATFQLQQNEPDFSLRGTLDLLDSANQYDGRCLMTPTASTQIDTNLRTFLIRTTLDDCRDPAAGTDAAYVDRLIAWYRIKHNVTPPDKNPEKLPWLKQQKPFIEDTKKDENNNPVLLPVKDLFAWYGDKPVNGPNNTVKSWDDAHQAQDPIYSAIRALNQLDSMPVLSQALGGFNASLMTRKQVLQIPIDNPVEQELPPHSFFGPLALTSRVAEAVGRHHPMAPLASLVFSPIRSGTLGLQSLTLNDTFGQRWSRSLHGAKVVSSNSLSKSNLAANTSYLPPRLASAARLNFRWLAAMPSRNGIDEVEMNSAPVTTPICGWLLPNNFDNSLMVYDNTGKALGSINLLAEWSSAPGSNDRITVNDIVNPHLRQLVHRLVIDVGMETNEITLRQDFLSGFLSTLDSAIEAIEPASFAQHEALALLMGRPIAVVRARVDLQLMGQPTHSEPIDDPTITGGKATRLTQSQHWKSFLDQDWRVFAFDWGQFYGCGYEDIMQKNCLFLPQNNDNYVRTTHGFENVTIPMRLGEHQLLNDGLVGFWKETADGELDNVFHAPQTLDDLKLSADITYKEGLTTPCIRAYVKGVTDNLSMTLQNDPLGLTILMDPRGVVHATCGLLPVYKLEIPATYYADVLKRMGVTFRVSPILTDAEELHAALPKEAGYVWSWITQPQVSQWEETSVIADATEHAHFFKPPKIIEGWLKLTPKKEGDKN